MIGTGRFLLYSHDGLGLGHISRNVAIARALVSQVRDASVLLVTGTDFMDGLRAPSEVEVLKLPGLKKLSNGRYVSRRLALSEEEIRSLRSRLLESAVDNFRPEVVLVDKHPFGVGGELRHALEWHRASGGRSALGLRDILDDKDTVLQEWAPYNLQEQVASFFDRVLIYGQPEVLDPISEYEFPEEMRDRTCFCGYVVNQRPVEVDDAADSNDLSLANGPRRKPLVLATVGGGEDGLALLERFLCASRGAPWEALAVSGPMVPGPDLARLRALAQGVGATFRTFLPDLPKWFKRVDTLVCMGGYNTLAEAVAQGTPIVCMPRSFPRREQVIRGEAFQRLGLVRVVSPTDVSPHTMRSAILESIGRSLSADRMLAGPLRFDGAAVAADELRHLAAVRTECRAPSSSIPFAPWLP